MSLDHYVPQVHLRNFYDSNGRLRGYNKRNGKTFPCKSEDVCRIKDGSTNDYLIEPRAVEEFLKSIEPRYNESITKLRARKLDDDAVFVIAGFVAYVASCAPAAQRLGAALLKAEVEAAAKVADRIGLLDDVGPVPKEIGVGTIGELIERGSLLAVVDPKYPQAIGVDGLLQRVSRFGNSHWEVFENRAQSSPFFTSDFPTALEASPNPRIENRVVPLAPDLALRIWPDPTFQATNKPNFPNRSASYVGASRHQIAQLNETIVRCAEELVFYQSEHEWTDRFLNKNRNYRVNAFLKEQQVGKRTIVMGRMAIGKNPA